MSDSEDEDFAYFGTPLEELDEDERVPRKAPRLEDQIAKDKQGRRRFHGAFMGGFSAGYYNSVGTKEGWTPSTFVSTKGQRAEAKPARPQDFMDDEDLGVFGISPQGIQASSNYDTSREHHKRKRVVDPNGPIPGTPVLEDILRPASETMGMKLLRRLGWRPGQGIGPRVSKQQKRLARKEKKRMYGCQRHEGRGNNNSSDGESSGSDDDDKDVTFAPDDVHTLSLPRAKQDTFGIGYVPLDRTPVLGVAASLLFDPSPLALTEKKKKLLIKGQAFGVGAFEEDDEDIYATEDMSIYDFGEDKKDSENRGRGAQSQQDKVMFGLAEALKGFKLSSKPHNPIKSYPRPSLPSDFTPHHKPRRRRFERKESEVRGLGRHDLTAEQRAKSIGEQPRATVEVRSGVKGHTPQAPPQHIPKKEPRNAMDTSEVDRIYEEFKSTNQKLGPEFKPFSKEPEKQKRYDLYLRMKEKGQKDRYYLAQPRGMTEWEREREVREFARASQLFQPLTFTMATRFVTSAVGDTLSKLKDGLNVNIPKMDDNAAMGGEKDPLIFETDDPHMKAAKLKMFGQMTQSTQDWYPDHLLCRRFNIPNPNPDSRHVGVRKSKREKLSLFSMMDADVEETAGLQKPVCESGERKEDSEEEDNQEDGSFEDKPETYGLKVPVDGPPTMDLFKAIFQDSDSETDDETEKAENAESNEKNDGTPRSANSQFKKPTLSDDSDGNKSPPIVKIEKNSLDIFLSSIRRGQDQNKAADSASKKNDRGRKRVSRFEPRAEDIVHNIQDSVSTTQDSVSTTQESVSTTQDSVSTTQDSVSTTQDSLIATQDSSHSTENPSFSDEMSKHVFIPPKKEFEIPKHIFVPKKKESVATKPTPARGIFANVDFNALNTYWNSEVTSSQQEEAPSESRDIVQGGSGVEGSRDKFKEEGNREADSDSSTDLEWEYGPAIPSHLRDQAQTVRSAPATSVDVVQKLGEKQRENLQKSRWVEKDEGKVKKSSKKVKHKHKHKKEKKKKEKKSKSHKERKKKKKKHKHISSSSSDSSTQSSD